VQDADLRMATLALLLIGAFAASIAPYQSLIAIELFGLSNAGYAAVLVSASLAAVSAAVGTGILTDQRANRRQVALVCGGLVLCGTSLVWFTQSRSAFILAHALIFPVGFSLFGQIFALARLAASSRPAGERDAILSAIRALFALPFIVVLPLWAVAYRAGVGLLTIYAALMVIAAALLATIALAWPRDGRTRWSDTPSGLSFGAALRELAAPHVAARVLMLGAIGGAVGLYLVLIALVFNATAGRGEADVALFVGAVAGVEVPFMLATPLLLGRFSKARLIAMGGFVYATFLALLPVLAPTPFVWVLVLPAAIGGAVILSLPIAYLQDLMSNRPGAGSSLMALQRIAGDTSCASAFAVGTTLSGYGLAAILGASVAVLGGLLLIRADRPGSTPVEKPLRGL
jgi:hypothetical protein